MATVIFSHAHYFYRVSATEKTSYDLRLICSNLRLPYRIIIVGFRCSYRVSIAVIYYWFHAARVSYSCLFQRPIHIGGHLVELLGEGGYNSPMYNDLRGLRPCTSFPRTIKTMNNMPPSPRCSPIWYLYAAVCRVPLYINIRRGSAFAVSDKIQSRSASTIHRVDTNFSFLRSRCSNT